jgi:prepilin-type processing-associated H-X9-DG protein/prepilin-type N-terminal cleavage/methylation domain-containing protein
MNRSCRGRPGFSLVELLVVISVIGVMVGLLMNAVQSVRGTAARAACGNTLRQLALACQHYHDTHSTFPPSDSADSPRPWPVFLLPYVEQENLALRTEAAYRAARWPLNNPPHVGLSTVVKVYTCPADGRLSAPITDDKGNTAAYGSYMGISYGTLRSGEDKPPDGAMRSATGVRLAEVTDGTSNTLLLGERPPLGRLLSGNWYTTAAPDPALLTDPTYPGPGMSAMPVFRGPSPGVCGGVPIQFGPGRVQNPCDSRHFWSLHPGGANFAFCDGSVRFLRYEAASILPALATRSGGEVVTGPD